MLSTLIIDDEPHIRRSLSRILENECKNVNLVGTAGSVDEGIAAIEKHSPELVLLDIKMDDGTGFDLLNKLQPINFKVIFITAYDQYAIQAFKYSAVDYLLKPVNPDDLVNAVKRVDEMVQQDFSIQLKVLNENLSTGNSRDKKIILKTSDTVHLVRINDIAYCEADLSYTRFYLAGGEKILVSKTLLEFEDLLRDAGFFRVHKSFLVNLSMIAKFKKDDGGYLIMENNDRVPVASRKREELLEIFERLSG